MNFPTKYDFGDKVREKVTKFEGIVMVKALYSTGCLHYGVSPTEIEKKDGALSDPSWIWHDESRWELVKKSAVNFVRDNDRSGPSQNPPKN